MIVYDGTKQDFLNSVDTDLIAEEIRDNILRKMGRHTPENEFKSWVNSMVYMPCMVFESPADFKKSQTYNRTYHAK